MLMKYFLKTSDSYIEPSFKHYELLHSVIQTYNVAAEKIC